MPAARPQTAMGQLWTSEAAFFLGVHAQRSGRFEEALGWMERALTLNPGHDQTPAQSRRAAEGTRQVTLARLCLSHADDAPDCPRVALRFGPNVRACGVLPKPRPKPRPKSRRGRGVPV